MLIGLLSLLFTGDAWARCDSTIYTADRIIADMQIMSGAIEKNNNDIIKRTGALMSRNILCVNSPPPPQVHATLYRYLGVYYFVSGNKKEASRWFRSALELNPAFQWGLDQVPVEIKEFYEKQRVISKAEGVALPDFSLMLPEDTELYLDGRRITEPKATEERPHVLFLVSKSDKKITARYLIDGNLFPESLLQRGKVENKQESVDSMFAVRQVQRVRPPSKTPLLVSGGVSLAIAAGLYGYTFKTNGEFKSAKSTEEMQQIQSINNTMVISSSVVALLGVGLGYTGIMIDSNGAKLGWHWDF